MGVPGEFVCPISLEIMRHPVVTPCGHRFDEHSLSRWLSERGNCPLDRKPLTSEQVKKDGDLKKRIKKYLKVHPEEKVKSDESRGKEPLIKRISAMWQKLFLPADLNAEGLSSTQANLLMLFIYRG